ncbi:hypothetical protein [Galbibacter mesophilus]|uniref:hypothetical protein n=1 Tax=Galbibacter mesophilus TaxID=379069 RepID=UPI00191C9F06|nr:hypothetical protein [Galbibacter mesophilus]MCM5662935.1 hypothetical protein [Galbibacter mesophilus]
MIEAVDSPYFIPAIAIIAFILGLLIGRALKNHKYQSEIEKIQVEKSRLANHVQNNNISFTEDNTIKAVQTRGRSGMALETDLKLGVITKSNATPKLDFSSIGIASEDAKDDLKKIDGIGSFIEKKLNSIGIFKYEQISRLTDKDIETITELIEFFPGRIKRDDWRGKAAELMSKKQA